MKVKTKILLILLLYGLKVDAQLINNKLDVIVGTGFNKPIGEDKINENGYIVPSLYNNYESINNILFRGTYYILPTIDLGLEYNNIYFSQWSLMQNNVYNASTSKISELGVVINLHSPFKNSGLLNVVEIYFLFSPFLASVKSKIPQKYFIRIDPEISETIENKSKFAFGVRSSIGLSYSINQNTGINLEIGMSHSKLKTQLSNDKKINLLNASFGVIFKYIKNKKYYL